MNNYAASLEITVNVYCSPHCVETCFGQVIENMQKNTIFTLNFHECLHTMYKYVLNSILF